MRRTFPGALVIALAALAVPAAAGAETITFPTGTAPQQYSPDTYTAAVNETVTFSGAFANHPLVWTDGDFPRRDGAELSADYQFTKPGTYVFHCGNHPAQMHGSIHVDGNQFATPGFSFGPAAPRTGQPVTFTADDTADPDGTIARYEWDLDGNGTFETASTAKSTTQSYENPGTFSVSVRYVDDGHEASPASAQQAVTVTGDPITPGGGGTAPGPGGSGGPGTGPGPGAADSTPPKASYAGTATFKVGTALGKGLRLAFTAGEPGRAAATLRIGTTTIAKGTAAYAAAGKHGLELALTKKGRTRLKRVAKGHSVKASLTLVVSDAAGNTSTVKRRLTLKR